MQVIKETTYTLILTEDEAKFIKLLVATHIQTEPEDGRFKGLREVVWNALNEEGVKL